MPQEVPLQNSNENTDTTCVYDSNENTQIQNQNLNYINIIYNTSNHIPTDDYKNSPAYKKACMKNNKDIIAPVELVLMAKKILKEKRRRSTRLFTMVTNALKNKINIVRANADKYIISVITDQIAKFELQREMYAYAIVKNNYRTSYNKSKKSSFANFTQRQYDCNKLEKQLLGWDNSDDDCEISIH